MSTQEASFKKIIVTFDTDKTTDKEFEDAKEQVEKIGGKVTKDFLPLMKSFAAEIPDSCDLSSFKNSFAQNKLLGIENDGIVTTQK